MSENRRFARFAGASNPLVEQPSDSLQRADQDIFGGENLVRRSRAPENALVKREDGAFVYKQFVMTAAGMDIPDGTDEFQWEDVGRLLRNLDSAVSWWVADWAAYAHRKWKATAKQIAEAFGYEAETIEPYISVAESIPGLIRNQAVSFSHHRRVAKMDTELQSRWIALAAAHGLTLKDFKAEIAILDPLRYETRIAKLDAALAQHMLVSQLPGLKRPAPLLPSKTQKQVKTFATYVENEQDNLTYMRADQRQAFAERTLWLAEHYWNLHLRATGKGE